MREAPDGLGGVRGAPDGLVREAPDGLVREAGPWSSQRAGEAGWAAWRAGLLGCPAGMAFLSAWRSCCSSSSVQAGGRVPLLCLGSWDALVPFKDCRRRCRRACAGAWTTKQPAHGRASAGPLMRGSGQLMRGSALMRGSGRAADARFGSKRSFPTGRHLGCGCEGFNRLWPTRGPGGRIYQVQRYEALVHAGSPTAGENRRRREPVIQSLYPENELCRQLHVAARVGMASRAMAQI